MVRLPQAGASAIGAMIEAGVRETLPGDVIILGHTLREEDVREVEGLIDVPAALALKGTVEASAWTRTIEVDGGVAGIFGVAPDPGVEDWGVVWFLAAPLIKDIRIRFLRESKEWVNLLFASGPYHKLHNIADTRNELHIKWLEWLGAKFDDEPIREHYRRFEIVR